MVMAIEYGSCPEQGKVLQSVLQLIQIGIKVYDSQLRLDIFSKEIKDPRTPGSFVKSYIQTE